MAVAFIRYFDNAPNIEIVFHYQHENVDRVFNLKRAIDEPVNTALKRIAINIEKEKSKKKKKTKSDGNQKPTETSQGVVELLTEKNDSTTWLNLLTNVDKFDSMILKVYEKEYQITYNYPYVQQLVLPPVILVGFDCFPSTFEVFFTERDCCKFEWYRGKSTGKNDAGDVNIVWNKCENGTNFFYKIQPADLGHKIKVK